MKNPYTNTPKKHKDIGLGNEVEEFWLPFGEHIPSWPFFYICILSTSLVYIDLKVSENAIVQDKNKRYNDWEGEGKIIIIYKWYDCVAK